MAVCAGLYAVLASSAVVSRAIVRLNFYPEGWQARFWDMTVATLVATLIVFGVGEALW